MTAPRPGLLPIVLGLAVSLATPAHVRVQVHQSIDTGAAAAWQKLLKLRTTASAMHTTAHPDDEHGGVLAKLSRGEGVHVSMLTLTRGESGDNAIGPELFDALGLIRTEELLVANRYYGVDRQYFTTAVDYGFSKRLDEALEKWGREHVLREVVRVIRTERPFIVISRFQGNERDGHGNHQAAGSITQEAFKLAGDPTAFPEQLETEGVTASRRPAVRPWQPLKLYMGGMRPGEDWTLAVDTGKYDPVLGESYQSLARLGLSFQRSQTGGRFNPQPGPALSYYKRLHPVVEAPARERSFFDGIDITVPGIFRALGKEAPRGADRLLTDIDREIDAAAQAFAMTDPSAAAPALARALAATRVASQKLGGDPDVRSLLDRKALQIQDAINAALGVVLTALAQPAGTPEPTGPFAAPAAMGPVAPGQTFDIRATFVNRSPVEVQRARVGLEATGDWKVRGDAAPADARPNEPLVWKYTLTVPENARLTRALFSRTTIQDARYTIPDTEREWFKPFPDPPLDAVGRYEIGGVAVEIRRPVTRLEANLPYGYDTRVLAVVPAIGVTLTPEHPIVPLNSRARTVALVAEVLNNRDGAVEGTLSLDLPAGWRATPAAHRFEFSRAGERSRYSFTVNTPPLEAGVYRVGAVAHSAGREYREGYTAIRHRDLETRYLYRDSKATVRGVDVTIAPGLKVGYVMGVGDEVPSGLAQLGVEVQLLGAEDLATGDLSRFDAIMTGTRAYAVREDLKTYNRRLLEYARGGGNLIVLYNTQEFVPNTHAPYPAALPRNAEEVSEEDSPVEILAPEHPVFTSPNRITKADFDGWVEQRGSKFWTTWDERYTPLIATWDTGQQPQRGGWLHARYGKGRYTYFAYAFHRQLPYGVAGAYRLLANLLSLGQA